MSYTQADIEEMNRFKAMNPEEQQKAFNELNGRIKAKADNIATPQVQTIFEKHFGVDKERSPDQWRALVKVYGMDLICVTEKMTVDQVRQRMNEPFAQYLKRKLKEKRANV